MYCSVVHDELSDPLYDDSYYYTTSEMPPTWLNQLELAMLMFFVIVAILHGTRSRENREIPD